MGEQIHRSPGTQYSTAVVNCTESGIQIPDIYIIADTVHVRVLARRMERRVGGDTVLSGGRSWNRGNDEGT